MFDDLKTYGIISVLLILVLGYFVYVIYRDNIILKNDIKEIKEFFYSEDSEEDTQEDEDDDEEYYEDEDQHNHTQQMDFKDIDEYFAHVKPSSLPVIEELTQEEPVVTEEKPKKKKPRKSKVSTEPSIEIEEAVQE